jgi:hypothetical protein
MVYVREQDRLRAGACSLFFLIFSYILYIPGMFLPTAPLRYNVCRRKNEPPVKEGKDRSERERILPCFGM